MGQSTWGVQKVVVRCEDAEENGGKLDLSNCKLIQVPDALYFMIEERNIEITACNLSSNVVKKIPPKFPTKFQNAANWRLWTFHRIYLFPCQIAFSTCRRSFKLMQQKTQSQMLILI